GSTPGVAGSARFTLDNLAGKPATMRSHGRAAQSARVGAQYRRPLEVVVRDGDGRPLQGATVTFALGAGGGGADQASGASFVGGSAQATAAPDAAGLAVSPLFVANAVAGRFTATASITGAPKAVTFALDNLAGRPPKLRPHGRTTQSARVGAQYRRPLEVAVRDGAGRPL